MTGVGATSTTLVISATCSTSVDLKVLIVIESYTMLAIGPIARYYTVGDPAQTYSVGPYSFTPVLASTGSTLSYVADDSLNVL